MILFIIVTFIIVCLAAMLFFAITTKTDRTNSGDDKPLTSILKDSRFDKENTILNNIKTVRKLVEDKIDKFDFVSDQTTVLTTINNLENKIKSLMHDPISHISINKNTLQNISKNIDEILNLAKAQPTEDIKDAHEKLKNTIIHLKNYIGKEDITINDIFDKLKLIYKEVNDDAVTKILSNVPKETIVSMENNLKTMIEQEQVRQTVVTKAADIVQTLVDIVQKDVLPNIKKISEKVDTL